MPESCLKRMYSVRSTEDQFWHKSMCTLRLASVCTYLVCRGFWQMSPRLDKSWARTKWRPLGKTTTSWATWWQGEAARLVASEIKSFAFSTFCISFCWFYLINLCKSRAMLVVFHIFIYIKTLKCTQKFCNLLIRNYWTYTLLSYSLWEVSTGNRVKKTETKSTGCPNQKCIFSKAHCSYKKYPIS